MRPPMPTHSAPGANEFRESLSAWHDGALPDESSRFVLKRLLQDEALRAEVGRWQAIGDALRQTPSQALGAGVAGRIDAAIEAEMRAGTVEAKAASSGQARRWWATAAVVGLAAVLLLPEREAPADATAFAVQGGSGPPVAVAVRDRPFDVPLSPIVRNAPMPLLARQRGSVEPDSLLANVPPLVRAPQPTAEQLAPLPAIDAPARPWPRSAGSQDTFTVDFAPTTGDASPRP